MRAPVLSVIVELGTPIFPGISGIKIRENGFAR